MVLLSSAVRFYCSSFDDIFDTVREGMARKTKKLRISFTISGEGIKVDTFNGKMDYSHSFPFSSIKEAEEKEKYFTISYISIRQKEYLLKSDITEGSVEELRQILTDNLGDKFKSAF